MRLTQQQLEAHLWGAANILRGKTAGQDYKNYILSLMFFKRLCDQWEDASDEAIEKRLKELQGIATDTAKTKEEPERLGLQAPGEYGLFTVLRAHAPNAEEAYVAQCARKMVEHLRSRQLLSPGWSNSKGGIMRVEQSLLAESWNPDYGSLGFDSDDADPAFLKPAVQELAKNDE